MSKIDKIKIDKLIHKLGLKYNMRDEDMKELIESPYLFTHEKLKELDLSNVQSEKELDKLKTNFLYKAFGRLYVSFPLIARRNKQREKKINLNKNGRKTDESNTG